MQSRWNDAEAEAFAAEARAAGQPEALGLRVYSSRLIGGDPDLVLHGGGNTSVKLDGPEGPLMHVKGSGWDLGAIEAAGLPALRLPALLAARDIADMTDDAMVALLRGELVDPAAPNPSVEALLHAFLPQAFVDHSHATAVLALADQEDMAATVRGIYGDRLAFVPYTMPGFALSIEGDRVFRAHPGCEGLWLEKHGLFTFGATAREFYERMIEFVTLAERFLGAAGVVVGPPEASDRPAPAALAEALRAALAAQGGLGPDPALDFRSTPSIRAWLALPDIGEVAARGTATPDHVIRIKPFPLLLSAEDGAEAIAAKLADFGARYRAYFARHAPQAAEPKTILDLAPRAALVPGAGVFGVGRSARDAAIAADLLEQTARIVPAAEAWGRFSPIAEAELFDMEYWSLEQAKLKPAAPAPQA